MWGNGSYQRSVWAVVDWCSEVRCRGLRHWTEESVWPTYVALKWPGVCGKANRSAWVSGEDLADMEAGALCRRTPPHIRILDLIFWVLENHWGALSLEMTLTCSFGKITAAEYACVLSCFSLVQLFTTQWIVTHQAPLSVHGFSRQEYSSGLPCRPPGDLPEPGIKPMSLMSPALAGGFFSSATWEAYVCSLLSSPGKKTGVGCDFLLQGIFPTQGIIAGRFVTVWATREASSRV